MGSVGAPVINEEAWILGEELCTFSCLPMAMKAAIELDVLQIIANAGSGLQVSPSQIVAQIPNVTNPDAAITLDRILRVLASHSLLTCSLTIGKNGNPERVYGLTALCKYLVKNKDGLSLAPLALVNQDKVFLDTWLYLKDAVLEGSQPFNKAHGVNAFEYPAKDQRFNRVFNRAMAEHSAMVMERILDSYHGFKDLEELLDVGGGVGSTLHLIWILHDWNDDHCIRILKNCYKALPEKGKLITVDFILPIVAETSISSRQAFHADLCMLAYNPGGKERTKEEFNDLAKESGFARGINPICCVNGLWVIEFYK